MNDIDEKVNTLVTEVGQISTELGQMRTELRARCQMNSQLGQLAQMKSDISLITTAVQAP